jgi:hypothetical protein
VIDIQEREKEREAQWRRHRRENSFGGCRSFPRGISVEMFRRGKKRASGEGRGGGEDKKSDGEARAHAKRAWISYFVSSVRSGRKHFRAQRYIYIYIYSGGEIALSPLRGCGNWSMALMEKRG